MLQQCFEKEVDCIITGEISYHDEVFCEMNGITVIALGHKESELFILDKIKEKLESQFPTLRITLSTGQALYKHH